MKKLFDLRTTFLTFIFFCTIRYSQAHNKIFEYGIASGDATKDYIILWTHLSYQTTDSVLVQIELASDSNFSNTTYIFKSFALKTNNYSFKIDAGPLKSDCQYFYRFIAQNDTSETGITYTLPGELATNFKIGFASCANYESGYFNAYHALSEIKDLKALVHLGDYIYEYGTGEHDKNKKANRQFNPAHELITLNDYRLRYKQYRLDPALKLLHSKVPFYCIWDDHEFADDASHDGADNHSNKTEGTWTDRSNAAKKAYFEWMPIRENTSGNIYRKIEIGKLLSLFFLDTRMDERNIDNQMMSSKQKKWFQNELKEDSSLWKITIQQVMMAPLKLFGVPLNKDQWDGFENERNELLNFINNEQIANFVVLSGDFHSSWASELKLNKVALGREIVCPGITSHALNIPFVKHLLPITNPHIKFADLKNRGFVTLEINTNYIASKWHFLETVDYPSSKIKSVYEIFLPVNTTTFTPQVPIEPPIIVDSKYNPQDLDN